MEDIKFTAQIIRPNRITIPHLIMKEFNLNPRDLISVSLKKKDLE